MNKSTGYVLPIPPEFPGNCSDPNTFLKIRLKNKETGNLVSICDWIFPGYPNCSSYVYPYSIDSLPIKGEISYVDFYDTSLNFIELNNDLITKYETYLYFYGNIDRLWKDQILPQVTTNINLGDIPTVGYQRIVKMKLLVNGKVYYQKNINVLIKKVYNSVLGTDEIDVSPKELGDLSFSTEFFKGPNSPSYPHDIFPPIYDEEQSFQLVFEITETNGQVVRTKYLINWKIPFKHKIGQRIYSVSRYLTKKLVSLPDKLNVTTIEGFIRPDQVQDLSYTRIYSSSLIKYMYFRLYYRKQGENTWKINPHYSIQFDQFYNLQVDFYPMYIDEETTYEWFQEFGFKSEYNLPDLTYRTDIYSFEVKDIGTIDLKIDPNYTPLEWNGDEYNSIFSGYYSGSEIPLKLLISSTKSFSGVKLNEILKRDDITLQTYVPNTNSTFIDNVEQKDSKIKYILKQIIDGKYQSWSLSQKQMKNIEKQITVTISLKKQTFELVSPEDGQTNVGTYNEFLKKLVVLLQWEPYPEEVDGYEVHYKKEGETNYTVKTITGYYVSGTYITSTTLELEPNTKYYWYVQTRPFSGVPVYTSTWSFTTSQQYLSGQVNLNKPDDNQVIEFGSDQTSINVGFEWEYTGSENVVYDFYYKQFNKNDTVNITDWYSSPVKQNLSSNILSLPIDLNSIKQSLGISNVEDQKIVWWVVQKSQNNPSLKTHSSYRTFTFSQIEEINEPPTKPTLIYPNNNSVDIDVSNINFQWNESTDPNGDTVTYRLYLGKSTSNMSLVQDNIPTNSYTYTGTLDELTTYYWKVVQTDGVNNVSSDIWSFKTKQVHQPPTSFNLISPTYNQSFSTHNTSIQINFSWEQSTDPDGGTVKYNLYYKKTSSSTYTKVQDLTTTSHQITISLPTGQGTYYWYVEQVDDEGNITKSSPNPNVFKIIYVNNPPNSFNLVSPTNDSTIDLLNDRTTLQWEQTTDPDGDPVVYDVYIGTNSSQLNKIQSGLTRTYYDVKLDYDKTYYWNIVQRDNRGGETKQVDIPWKFKTNQMNQPPKPFTLVYPYNESSDINYHTINFIWEETTDPEGGQVTYDFYLSTDNKFNNIVRSETGLTEPTITITEVQPETTYFWKVVQKDQEGRERECENPFYFTTRTSIYTYNLGVGCDYGIGNKRKFINQTNGISDIEVGYELVNSYESNVYLMYKNNEVVNRTQYIPYVDFWNILHKEHSIKLNDLVNGLKSDFTLDLNSITNDNVVFEIDRPDEKVFNVKNTRYSYVLKTGSKGYVEQYEKDYELNDKPITTSMQLGQVSSSELDIVSFYKELLEDLKGIYVSEMKILVSEETQKEMLRRIKEMYDYKEPIITFLVNHVFHIDELSLNNIETKIQLPQLWKQYVIQIYQKDLKYSEIYRLIYDYYKLQEKNYLNLKFMDYVIGYGSFNLSRFLDLRENVDDFVKRFDPYFYNLVFELTLTTYNEILSELLYQYEINDDGTISFKQKTDVMKMFNKLIYQEKVLKGEQTINQQLIYDDVNELVDYLNYFDTEGYKSDMLYSFYFNKEPILELLQKLDNVEIFNTGFVGSGVGGEVETDRIRINLLDGNKRLIRGQLRLKCRNQLTGEELELKQDRDGILRDENSIEYGFITDKYVVIYTFILNTSLGFIDFIEYSYDDKGVYYPKTIKFDEVENKDDLIIETDTHYIVRLIIPQKYRVMKNSVLIKVQDTYLYDVDGYIQTTDQLTDEVDYTQNIVGDIDYRKGLIMIPKTFNPDITLEDFEYQSYGMIKADNKLEYIINGLTKPVDMTDNSKDFKDRISKFIYTKYNKNEYYTFTTEELNKLHLKTYYRMILNMFFFTEEQYETTYNLYKDQVVPVVFYKKSIDTFMMNDYQMLYRDVKIPFESFSELLKMLDYDDSIYSFKINIYPVQDQVDYFKQLYPDITILNSYDVYEDINNMYSVVEVKLDDVNQINQDDTIQLFENISQKRRLLISLSNSLITLKLNDDFNTDDYTNIMYEQRNYIIYNKKQLKQSKLPYFNVYDITENGIEQVDKDTEYLSYFIPFFMNQQYSVTDIDKVNLKLSQNTNERDNIQVIMFGNMDFLISQSGQIYKFNWR